MSANRRARHEWLSEHGQSHRPIQGSKRHVPYRSNISNQDDIIFRWQHHGRSRQMASTYVTPTEEVLRFAKFYASTSARRLPLGGCIFLTLIGGALARENI
jgi:hypothetical protein